MTIYKMASPRRELFISEINSLREDELLRTLKMLDHDMRNVIASYADNYLMGVPLNILKGSKLSFGNIVTTRKGRKFIANQYLDKYINSFMTVYSSGVNVVFTSAPIHMGRTVGGYLLNQLINSSTTFCGFYISSRDLFSLMNEASFGKTSTKYKTAQDAIIGADLLIIDRVGGEGIFTDNTKSMLISVINDRLSLGVPTIVFSDLPYYSSNKDVKSLGSVYNGISVLLESKYDIFEVSNFEVVE